MGCGDVRSRGRCNVISNVEGDEEVNRGEVVIMMGGFR